MGMEPRHRRSRRSDLSSARVDRPLQATGSVLRQPDGIPGALEGAQLQPSDRVGRSTCACDPAELGSDGAQLRRRRLRHRRHRDPGLRPLRTGDTAGRRAIDPATGGGIGHPGWYESFRVYPACKADRAKKGIGDPRRAGRPSRAGTCQAGGSRKRSRPKASVRIQAGGAGPAWSESCFPRTRS
jgi:hypothetical protein